MTTGYEKILALIDRKNEKGVSEVSPRINNGINSINSETTLKPQGFRAAGLSVSGEQPTSPSLSDEDPDWIEEIIELALTGQLTGAVLVPVRPVYQDILGQRVWFCPDLATAEGKMPDLALTPEELIVIIPLLIDNRELASTLICAKRIFGGTIMDLSLLDLPTAEPHGSQAGSEDFQAPEEDSTLDPAVSQSLDQNYSHHQDSGGIIQSPRGGLPKTGRHLVRIINVLGYLHNFPEYTGSRARIEMEILEGPDAGKTIVDKVSLPHPKESKGMQQRRVRIAHRLGLIAWGAKGIIQLDWKLLEAVVCWVDVAYKSIGGRKVLTVDNYELQ